MEDPIEEDNDPLEELSTETRSTIQKINKRMRCIEKEWNELKKIKQQYANYLSNLQNCIVSRSFVQQDRRLNESLYNKEIEEEEIVPTQKCN